MFELLDDKRMIWWKRIKSDYLFPSSFMRLGTRLLDIFILYVFILPFVIWERIILHQVQNNGESMITFFQMNKMVNIVSLVLIIILELAIPLITKGKTLGKLITRQRIISKDGRYASPLQLTIRSLFIIVILLSNNFRNIIMTIGGDNLDVRAHFIKQFIATIGYAYYVLLFIVILLLFIQKYHRTLHDYLSGTCVVYDRYYHKRRDQFIKF